MRYYIKCKLNPMERKKLAESIKAASLAKGKIFYEGMQSALREGTIDDDGIVHFIEVCYCLEGGLYPMAMEIPTLKDYFESVELVKDARLRDECTMECEACDCTRAIKLPGRPLLDELNIRGDQDNNNFLDMGRLPLNRKRQREGLEALKIAAKNTKSGIVKPIMAGAAVSGLFVIFKDNEYFRIKNIPDNAEARQIINYMGLPLNSSVESIKVQAIESLAKNDKRSNIV
jgi:hypothetical protein